MWLIFLLLVTTIAILDFITIKIFLSIHNAKRAKVHELETDIELLSNRLKQLRVKFENKEDLQRRLEIARNTIYRLTKELEYKGSLLKDIETKNNELQKATNSSDMINKMRSPKENNLAKELNKYEKLRGKRSQ